MAKLIRKLEKYGLEMKLGSLALTSFTSGMLTTEAIRAISERNYALAVCEIISTAMFSYFAYDSYKELRQIARKKE